MRSSRRSIGIDSLDLNNDNNNQIQQTPRTKLNYDQQSTKRLMLNLIMTLDANQIDCIRNEFRLLSNSDGANLFEFVSIMRKHVHASKLNCSEDELLAALVELFDSMDLDGNHCLDFDEFLASIVHMGMGGADNFILDLIKPYRNAFTLRVTFSNSRIEAILSYSEVLDSLLCLEMGTNQLTFYSPSNMKQTRQIQLENSGYICMTNIFLETLDHPIHYLLLSTSQSIQIWDITSVNIVLIEEIRTNHPISTMEWSTDTKKLYTGDLAGDIIVWHFTGFGSEMDTNNKINSNDEYLNGTRTNSNTSTIPKRSLNHSLEKDCVLKGHTDLVTNLLVTSTMELLISSSLDGTVRLWDLTHGEEKNVFDGHESGVVDIAYSNKFRFLFSAGMDHNIGVWSPFGSQKITLLKGHVAPLSAITCIRNTPRVVSIDISGILRVWDARNFSCVQTLQTVTNMVSFASCGPIHRRVAIASDSFFEIYDQVDSLYNNLGKEDTPFTVIYNSITHSVVTATHQEIRVYNSLTGKLSRVFRNLCWTEITAVCFDHSRRKLIVGEHSGKISVFNFLTGNFMKALTPHSSEIIDLHNCKESSTIISVSRDNCVFVHDETPMDEQRVLLKLRIPDDSEFNEITASCFSFDISLIAVSTVNHNIYIWDMETGKFEGVCKGHMGAITALTFLGKFPFLASADDYGNVMIWYMRPSPLQYTCGIRFINPFMDHIVSHPQKTTNRRRTSLAFLPNLEKAINVRRRSSVIWVEGSEYEGYCSISSLAFNADSEFLFTADAIGRVRKWPLRSFFQQLGTGPINLELLDNNYIGKTRRYSQILRYGRIYEENNRDKRHLSYVGELVLLPHEFQFVDQFQITPRSNMTESAMSNGWVDAIGIAKILLVNDALFCITTQNDVDDIETMRIPLTCWSTHGTLLGALGTGYVRKDGVIKHQHLKNDDIDNSGDPVVSADKIEWLFTIDVQRLRDEKQELMKDIIKVGQEGHILDATNTSIQRYHQRLLRKHGYETIDLEEDDNDHHLSMRETLNHLVDQGKRHHIKLRENQNHSPILASSITSFKEKQDANQGLVLRLAALEQHIKDDYNKRKGGKKRFHIRERTARTARHPSSRNRTKKTVNSKQTIGNNNTNDKQKSNKMSNDESEINKIVMAPKISKIRIEKLPKRKNMPYSYDDNSNDIDRKELEKKLAKHREMKKNQRFTKSTPNLKSNKLNKYSSSEIRPLLVKSGIRHSRFYGLMK